jgi:hypothetical protein
MTYSAFRTYKEDTINAHKILRGTLETRYILDDRLKSIFNNNSCWSVEHTQIVQGRKAQFFRQLSSKNPFSAAC